ncbi:hypothetical protein PVAG01_10971 [Phlyctema vagabunda]|uniref:Uncharacterized protein n=1 Tax=Phlyctema vagabunda TaxID=108571 RepID=A0ABR4P3R9_9HELO
MSAAIPASLAQQQGRRSSSSSRRAAGISHGRGGAGNMSHSAADADPVTLDTPTIKTEVYTTGRGGSGNMAKNHDPAEARRAQDVVGHPRRESGGTQHVGRGGAANIFKPSKEDLERSRKEDSAVLIDDDERPQGQGQKGFAEKGKDWLLGKKANKA